jgi:hypothetical protein
MTTKAWMIDPKMIMSIRTKEAARTDAALGMRRQDARELVQELFEMTDRSSEMARLSMLHAADYRSLAKTWRATIPSRWSAKL